VRLEPVIRGWIVDFHGFAARLLIEADGDVHDMQRAEEERRTHALPLEGLEALRVRNEEALTDVPRSVATIVAAIHQPRVGPDREECENAPGGFAE
jgi:very-short-patch-repair endonuclease